MQEQEGPLLHRAPFLRSAQWQVMARSVPKLPSLGKESQETKVFGTPHPQEQWVAGVIGISKGTEASPNYC